MMAIMVGHLRPPFVDWGEAWPFCKDRKDLAAGDGIRSRSSGSSPSYRGVESDRDSKGVFSWSSLWWECFELDLSPFALPRSGDEGLSDIVVTDLSLLLAKQETRRPARELGL